MHQLHQCLLRTHVVLFDLCQLLLIEDGGSHRHKAVETSGVETPILVLSTAIHNPSSYPAAPGQLVICVTNFGDSSAYGRKFNANVATWHFLMERLYRSSTKMNKRSYKVHTAERNSRRPGLTRTAFQATAVKYRLLYLCHRNCFFCSEEQKSILA